MGPGIPKGCGITCGGGGGSCCSGSLCCTVTGTALAFSTNGSTGGGGGGGGIGTVSVVAVEAAEAPPSVVELLVVSDKSRYLTSSLLVSSDGLEEVEEED